MNTKKILRKLFVSVTATLLILPVLNVSAAESSAQQIQSLQKQIDELKQKVDNAPKQESYKKAPHQHESSDTMIHMAGYADVGYSNGESDDGSYAVGTFAPIFHYQYKDLVMLESELDIQIDEVGETEIDLEYLTIDIFLNDYVTLVMGKFLSPIGQFRQNLHPSWINKQPSAPVGFGHDQAAPNAEVGIQFRGGIPTGPLKINYAVYGGNGPALEQDAGEFDKIETPGMNVDGDGNKVYGGRLGAYIPAIKLDIGASGAAGRTAVWDTGTDPVTYERSRDYQAIGADFATKFFGIDFRGEYVKQMIGKQIVSAVPEKAEWSAWYSQVAYLVSPIKTEFALRYGAYNTPERTTNRTQTAISVNYLFTNNVIGKVGYENNEIPNDLNPKQRVDNRVLVQLAYGF